MKLTLMITYENETNLSVKEKLNIYNMYLCE